MTDRVVQYPARYQLVLVAGTTDTYDLVAVPGTVSAEGTPLNKANLLTDAICAALGIATTSVPVDAISALTTLANSKAKIEVTTYTGTGTSGNANAKSVAFSGVPKVVFIKGGNYSTAIFVPAALTTSYADCGYVTIDDQTAGSGYRYAKKSSDGKTLYWYHTSEAEKQLNTSGQTYTAVAITL